jgi:hypothetical protein
MNNNLEDAIGFCPFDGAGCRRTCSKTCSLYLKYYDENNKLKEEGCSFKIMTNSILRQNENKSDKM